MDYVKHLFIRTPLEAPLLQLRKLYRRVHAWRAPELVEIHREPEHIDRVFRRIVAPHSCCMDIGAHLGSVTSLFTRLAPHGKHIAVEPTPKKAQWLRRKFSDVEVWSCALSNEPGTKPLFVNPKQTGTNSLRQSSEFSGPLRHVEVQCQRLDDTLAPDRRIDVMKIDVEGAELDVFRSAEQTLRRCHPIIVFECTQTGLQDFGTSAADVHGFLEHLGYGVFLPAQYLTGDQPLDAASFEQSMQYPFRAFNFVAAPKN